MDLGLSNLAPKHSIQGPKKMKPKVDSNAAREKRKQKRHEINSVLKKQKTSLDQNANIAFLGGLRSTRSWDGDRLVFGWRFWMACLPEF